MRRMLTLCFWLWSLIGAALNFYQLIQAHRLAEITVATSAVTIMDVSFWAGGMILLGLGAAITPGEAMVVRAVAPNTELDRGWGELFRAFLLGLIAFVVVTGMLAVWIVVIFKPTFFYLWR